VGIVALIVGLEPRFQIFSKAHIKPIGGLFGFQNIGVIKFHSTSSGRPRGSLHFSTSFRSEILSSGVPSHSFGVDQPQSPPSPRASARQPSATPRFRWENKFTHDFGLNQPRNTLKTRKTKMISGPINKFGYHPFSRHLPFFPISIVTSGTLAEATCMQASHLSHLPSHRLSSPFRVFRVFRGLELKKQAEGKRLKMRYRPGLYHAPYPCSLLQLPRRSPALTGTRLPFAPCALCPVPLINLFIDFANHLR